MLYYSPRRPSFGLVEWHAGNSGVCMDKTRRMGRGLPLVCCNSLSGSLLSTLLIEIHLRVCMQGTANSGCQFLDSKTVQSFGCCSFQRNRGEGSEKTEKVGNSLWFSMFCFPVVSGTEVCSSNSCYMLLQFPRIEFSLCLTLSKILKN